MTTIAQYGVQLAEALADDDGLAAAQVLADARSCGGAPAVRSVLEVAVSWSLRVGAPPTHINPRPLGALRPAQPLGIGTGGEDARASAVARECLAQAVAQTDHNGTTDKEIPA